MIVFYINSWQATNPSNEIITNIYVSFVFTEVLTSFQNYFMFIYEFMLHHSICILWFDSGHSVAEYFISFHSNNNFSKHSLCTDCYENEIIYHRRCYCNFLQSHILVLISRSKMYFFFRNVREDNATDDMFNTISKNIKIN